MKNNSQKRLITAILVFIFGLAALTVQSYSTITNAAVKPEIRSSIAVIPSPDEFSWKGGSSDITITGDKFSSASLMILEINGQQYTADYVDSSTFILHHLPIPENGTGAVKTEEITVYLDKENLGALANIKINPKQPNMNLTKTVQKKLDEYQVGEQVIYEITVTNTGDCDLTNIHITDALDPSWSHTIPLLPEGSFESVIFPYTIQNSDSGSILTNRAECSAYETGKTEIFDEASIQIKAEAETQAPTSPTAVIPSAEASSAGTPSGVLIQTKKAENTNTNTTAHTEESTMETEPGISIETEPSEPDEKSVSPETREPLENSDSYISEVPQTGEIPFITLAYLFTAAAALIVFLSTIKNLRSRK